ncbi:MAG: hypothetical protein ABIB61_03875 [Candidatus Shapirobacteria bacterium]
MYSKIEGQNSAPFIQKAMEVADTANGMISSGARLEEDPNDLEALFTQAVCQAKVRNDQELAKGIVVYKEQLLFRLTKIIEILETEGEDALSNLNLIMIGYSWGVF